MPILIEQAKFENFDGRARECLQYGAVNDTDLRRHVRGCLGDRAEATVDTYRKNRPGVSPRFV